MNSVIRKFLLIVKDPRSIPWVFFYYTPEGQTPGAYDPTLSGQVDLGDHTAGFEVPNAFVPGRQTETTSQRLTRQQIDTYLQGLTERKLSNEEVLNDMERQLRQLEEGGAAEQVMEQWMDRYESCVDQLASDPTDITDYSKPYDDAAPQLLVVKRLLREWMRGNMTPLIMYCINFKRPSNDSKLFVRC